MAPTADARLIEISRGPEYLSQRPMSGRAMHRKVMEVLYIYTNSHKISVLIVGSVDC